MHNVLVAGKTGSGNLLKDIAAFGNNFGVHLILATQMLSPDVLVPELKANLQTRICFPVAEKEDSLLIVHEEGAEKLKTGEFLYKTRVSTEIIKIKARKRDGF